MTGSPVPPPPRPPTPTTPTTTAIERLTIGELEELEEAAGLSLGAVLEELKTEMYHVRTIRAVLWIIARRNRPELTLEEAGELELSDLDKLWDAPMDPIAPAEAGS